MTTLFDDTFTGSGNLTTHTVDAGDGWVRVSGVLLSAHTLVSGDLITVGSPGVIHPVCGGAVHVLGTDYELEITFGDDGTSGDTNGYGFDVTGTYKADNTRWSVSIVPNVTEDVFDNPGHGPDGAYTYSTGAGSWTDLSFTGIADVLHIARTANNITATVNGVQVCSYNDVIWDLGDYLRWNMYDFSGVGGRIKPSRFRIFSGADQFWTDYVKTTET